ncbi:hypothetical protein DM01DRAFT_1139432 [Hesseltinella vesiculosa]|uniref:Uncharacterized protein n=1 Tax=Hesseltinella vesiculosa TaxID=101127 RepID=A0A1X2G7Z9_9FUNG|nr:hypothetical protein DM01DRAFT_1139432 [Hesseltinella vesiculosa]
MVSQAAIATMPGMLTILCVYSSVRLIAIYLGSVGDDAEYQREPQYIEDCRRGARFLKNVLQQLGAVV